MDLPIKFPSETEVILEDVARFRALSPADRVQSYRGFLHSCAWLAQRFATTEPSRRCTEEHELLAQKNIREFLNRHGY